MWRGLPLLLAIGCGADPQPMFFGAPADLAMSEQSSVCHAQFDTFSPTWRPPTGAHQARCNGAEIDQFIAAAASGQTALDQFTVAHGGCATCLMVPSTSGPLGPFFTRMPQGFIDGNVGGCVMLHEASATPTGCGAQVQANADCGADLCRRCQVKINADVIAYEQCLLEAESVSSCSAYAGASGCAGAVPQASLCSRSSWASGADWERYLAELFCGAPGDS